MPQQLLVEEDQLTSLIIAKKCKFGIKDLKI